MGAPIDAKFDDGVGARARSALSAQNRSWVVDSGGAPNGGVKLIINSTTAVDLGFLNESDQLHLELQTSKQVNETRFVNLPGGAGLLLTVSDIPATAFLKSIEFRSCGGSVEILSTPQALIVQTPESPIVVRIDDAATVKMRTDGSNLGVPELRGGELQLSGELDSVRIDRGGKITRANPEVEGASQGIRDLLGRVGRCEVLSNSTLTVGSPSIRFGHIVGCSVLPRPLLYVDVVDETKTVLHVDVPGGAVKRPGSGPLTVESLENLTLDVDGTKRTREAKNCTFTDASALTFEKKALLSSVRCLSGDRGPVELTLGEETVATDITGEIQLNDARHVNLTAGIDGVLFRAPLSGRNKAAAGAVAERPFEGLVISGARLPTGLEGRRILTMLADAYHFSPDVRGIPGHDQTVWAKLFQTQRTRYRRTDVALHEDAEYVRELARLSREKGAPGSVTTRIAWCAYRLRALKTVGTERLALAVYRLFGYGERPAPALALWLVLSLVLAGPVLWAGRYSPTWSWRGYGQTLLEASRLALGPLAGLSRSGNLTTSDVLELFARALISAPLVTGILALRNYVKGTA